jgi:hypothetical protein
MKVNASVFTLVFVLIGCTSVDKPVRIWPDATACVAAEYPRSVRKSIEIASGVWINAMFEITSKGNGAVHLPGLSIRVYDSHNDGLVFRDWLLLCQWLDADGGGFLDFIVSGVGIRTDEETEQELESFPVRGMFRYDPQQHRFEAVVCSPEILFWKTMEGSFDGQ